jgi:hypothetical protein
VVSKCKKNFGSYGIPQVVICDNGVQFLSTESRKFATKYEFNISPCLPYHKEGNGKAKATIKIAKLRITKSIEAKTDIELVLLNWCNTPNKIGTGSFSERSEKIGRGGIKILETWQFGLSFNIMRHVFFCFGQKKINVGFMNFLKILVLRKKFFVKSRYWL